VNVRDLATSEVGRRALLVEVLRDMLVHGKRQQRIVKLDFAQDPESVDLASGAV
jgi:hypothetical protein